MARRAQVDDVHTVAKAMPGVKLVEGGRAVYQVSGRSFVFFRNPRPDAFDPETGERYDDVIVFWVESEEAKHALVDDESSPYFTTPHFDGHPSVLLRGAHIDRLDVDEITEVVQDAWLARASKTAARKWLAERGLA
ncbi:MmcQ/YjbR family DNA-binding protein [Nocardioides sp. LHG3406-4]|uniref:MmcQ/YjbR family DNA-binding protein n=1 Tax=Nocardioides sp. LHG3406-4 TaxID=2804575 RepID=UPI003CEF671F